MCRCGPLARQRADVIGQLHLQVTLRSAFNMPVNRPLVSAQPHFAGVDLFEDLIQQHRASRCSPRHFCSVRELTTRNTPSSTKTADASINKIVGKELQPEPLARYDGELASGISIMCSSQLRGAYLTRGCSLSYRRAAGYSTRA